MNITSSLIDQFIAIAGETCTREDAEKFLKMSKGSVEIGLNYFYNKIEKTEKKPSSESKVNKDAFSRLKEGSVRQAQLEKVIKEVRKNYYQPVMPSAKKDEPTVAMPDDLMVTTDVSANLERIRQQLKNSKFAKDFVIERKSTDERLPAVPLAHDKSLEISDLNVGAASMNRLDDASISKSLPGPNADDFKMLVEVEGASNYTPNKSISQVDFNGTCGLSGKKTAVPNDTPDKSDEALRRSSSDNVGLTKSDSKQDNSVRAEKSEPAVAKAKEKKDIWVSQPVKRDFFQFEHSRSLELKSKLEQEAEWPKFLGEMTIKAFVIGSLSRKVNVGDSVLLAREKQILTNVKKSKKDQRNSATASVIRVVHDDWEIGKLENMYAVMLGCLLDKNYVFIEAEVLSPPSDWNYFSPFTLKAKVYLSQEVITKPITKIFSTKETAQGQEEVVLAKMEGTREAFISLFELLNLNKITDTLIQRQPKALKQSESNGETRSARTKIKMLGENSMDLESDGANSRSVSFGFMDEKSKSKPVLDVFDPFQKAPKQASLQSFKLQNSKANAETSDAQNAEKKLENANNTDVVVQQETNDIDYVKLLNLENPNQDELKLTEPPESFTSILHNYQKQALTWMLTREGQLSSQDNTFNEKSRTLHALWEEYKLPDNSALYFNPYTGQLSIELPRASPDCKGGILADEMGLGKTVMMISLIHSHRVKKSIYSKSSNGPGDEDFDEPDVKLETKKMKPNNGIISKSFSAGQKPRAGTLIIVPLTLLSQWDSELETHSKTGSISVYLYYGGSRGGRGVSLANYDVVITTYGIVSSEFVGNSRELYRYDWFRVVLDEAHYIKGRTIQIAKAVYELSATHKWCLSGTPVQNKLDDLFSLIHFLKLEPWSDYVWWNTYINKPNESNDPIVFKILQTILKPILLRRTKKTQQSNGEMLVDLPERVQKIEFVQLTREERDIYDCLFRKSKTEFDQYVAEGTVLTNYVHVFEILLRLRQTCDHPFLIFTRKDVQPKEQMESAIYKFLERYEVAANENIYPKNPLEKLDLHDHFEIVINEETHEEQRIEIKKSAKTSNPDFLREQIGRLKKGEALDNCPVCISNVDDAVITVCAHIACRECLIRAIDTTSMCPVCRHILTRRDFMTIPRDNRFSMDINQKYKRSSKIEAVIKHVEEVVNLKEKCVIFSQWVSMLDLVEFDLKQSGIGFTRLDGSLSQKKRTEVLNQFKTDPSINVFLISLKAGGVGLNLTAANHVFLIDPWWNPAVEDQAVERVHRIGQKKNVEIIRFICSQTVEERIIELHQQKKDLFDSTISRNQEEKKALNIENFKYLMRNY